MFYIKIIGNDEPHGEPKSGSYSMHACEDYLVAHSKHGTSLILDNSSEENKKYFVINETAYVMNIKGETIDKIFPIRVDSKTTAPV